MRLRPLNFRFAALLAISLSCLWATGAGYLARVGPVPVRYEPPRGAGSELFVLPPLDAEVVVAAPAPPPPVTNQVVVAAVPPSKVEPPPVLPPVVQPPAPATPPVVPPQAEDEGDLMGKPGNPFAGESLVEEQGGRSNASELLRFFKRNRSPGGSTVIQGNVPVIVPPATKSSTARIGNN